MEEGQEAQDRLPQDRRPARHFEYSMKYRDWTGVPYEDLVMEDDVFFFG
jgi:hypothetical protein